MSEELNLRQAAERLIYWSNRIAAATTEAEENECCDERDKLFAVFRKVDAERASPTPPTTEGRGEDARLLALEWALAEIDILSNKLVQFAYPQAMPMLGREDQAENYFAARSVARALLSSPRVEDVRREALEEAAKIVEAMSPTYVSNGRRFLKENGAALDELAPHLEAQRVAKLQLQGKPDINEFERAAASIRSLSLPDGEGDKQATRASGPTAPTDL